MRILLVIDGLGYGGAARQLTLLAPELMHKQFETHVCVLGSETPWTRLLSRRGVGVTTLKWTRTLDARPLWRLRQIVRQFQPDLVHALGHAACRAAAIAAKSTRIVASHSHGGRERSTVRAIDRWLFAHARKVIAGSGAEAGAYRRLRVDDRKIRLIPPGVQRITGNTAAPAALRESLELPPSARLVACVGPLMSHKGFKDAVWAFDILKYVYEDLYLLLIGDGPVREELQRFARSIRADDRIRWLGEQAAVPHLLTEVDVVWVPSHVEGGTNAALEAMAAGRPVVASRLPGLAEIVIDGETGFLVACTDKAALARRTHLLLKQEEMRRHLGDAGRERAGRCFSVENLVDAYANLYEEAA